MTGVTPIPVGQYIKLSNGLKMHVHEQGRASTDRPTLLFLHGSGPGASGYSNFRSSIDYFSDLGWHVLIPDYIGYGLSDKPTDLIYSSSFHVGTLIDLMQQKSVRSVVPIGNSLGGALAMELALDHPELVERLILMGPGGMQDPSQWASGMAGLRAMAGIIGPHNTDRQAFGDLLQLIVADPATITDIIIDERLPIWVQQPPEVFSTMRVGVYADRLNEVKVPVLCFWGQRDQFVPVQHAAILAGAIQDARIIISTKAGHWFMIELPDYFNREIKDFLENG